MSETPNSITETADANIAIIILGGDASWEQRVRAAMSGVPVTVRLLTVLDEVLNSLTKKTVDAIIAIDDKNRGDISDSVITLRSQDAKIPIIVVLSDSDSDDRHLVNLVRKCGHECYFCLPEACNVVTTLRNAVTKHQQSLLQDERMDSIKRRVDELFIISKISQDISSELNIDVLLNSIISLISSMMNVKTVSCMLHDSLRHKLVLQEFSGLPETIQKGHEVDESHGIAGHVFQTRKPLLINDIKSHDTFRTMRSGSEYSTASLLCAPLIVKQKVIGILNVTDKINGLAFDDYDLSLIKTISSQAAVAIENARLYSELEQKEREMRSLSRQKSLLYDEVKAFNHRLEERIAKATEKLNDAYEKLDRRERELNEKVLEFISMKEVGEAVSTELNPDIVLKLILNLALGHLKAEQGSIMLREDGIDLLRIKVAYGLNEEIIRETAIPYGVSIAGHVAREGTPLLITDIEQHPLLGKVRSDQKYRNKSLLCVPLKVQQEVIGVINVNNKSNNQPFNEQDLNILSAFANQASLAIEKARLHRKVAASEQARQRLEKYLSPHVIRKIVEEDLTLELGGVQQNITVLFLDIRGFTTIADSLAPVEMVTMLNEFLGIMTDIIFNYDGTLDKYTGDGLMAVFGAPLAFNDHAERALKASFDMMQAAENKFFYGNGNKRKQLRMGIGINSGIVTAGNVGSIRRMEYTVIGDTVNVAHRLEKFAGPQEIVISESTYARVADMITIMLEGHLTMKGKSQQVHYYAAAPRSDKPIDGT